MNVFHGMMANATETTVIDDEISNSLIAGETVLKSYKLVRDELVFTNKRIISLDKQGLTGKKMEVNSIPYRHISRFAKECAGNFDMDEEPKIWVGSSLTPLTTYKFKKGGKIDEIYKILSTIILS